MNVTFVSGYVLSDENKLMSLVLFCFNFLLLLILPFLLPFNVLSLLIEQMKAAVTLRLLMLLERDAFRNLASIPTSSRAFSQPLHANAE